MEAPVAWAASSRRSRHLWPGTISLLITRTYSVDTLPSAVFSEAPRVMGPGTEKQRVSRASGVELKIQTFSTRPEFFRYSINPGPAPGAALEPARKIVMGFNGFTS